MDSSKQVKNQIRVDFLYRIYKDLLDWLDKHEEAKKWIYEISEDKRLKYDEWWMDDFLGYFEAIWSFDNKKLVDKDIVYDLFSDYLISAYEAYDFTLKKKIEELRREEKPDHYIGITKLYEEMKNSEK